MKLSTAIHHLETGLDRAIGIFAPGREASRIDARLRTMQLRQFAAAKHSRLMGDWAPVATDINSLIRSSNATVRNRTRQLVGDFAYFARAVQILVDHTIGTGITMQSRIVRGTTEAGKAKLHSTAIRSVEDAWARWCEEADAAGKLHYHELERLWKRQDVVDGESIVVLAWDTRPGRYLPLSLQAYEADWLSSDYAAKPASNALIDQGVEFDRITGRVIAYHFRVPDGFSPLTGNLRSVRVEAENVLHGFEMLRPGQLRGVSPFTPAILLADDLQEYLGANIDRAKMAAKWLAFVETEDAGKWQRGRTTTDSDTGRRQTVLDNAIIDFLSPGDKVNINTAEVPGDAFGPFVRFVLQMLAVSVGVPYELVSGDSGGLNYNTTRTVRNDWAKALRPMVSRHIRQYSQPIYRAFLDACHLTGRINMPGYASNPLPWQACMWQPNGVEPLDLLRESRGQIDLKDNYLWSPQEIIAARGRDPEEVLNEHKEWREMCASRDLQPVATSKALQTNPAAVAGNPTAPSKQEGK